MFGVYCPIDFIVVACTYEYFLWVLVFDISAHYRTLEFVDPVCTISMYNLQI